YYWNTVFGGFHHPASGSPGPDKSLYKGCRTQGSNVVQLLLTRRSTSFLGALALTNFGIASPTALKKYKADAGTVDSSGVVRPASLQRRLRGDQPGETADEPSQGSPGTRLRARPGVRRQQVLCRTRTGRDRIPAAVAQRLRRQGRAQLSVQPEQGEAAPPAGR